MLRVYEISAYEGTQMLRGDVQGFLGEWNLAKLKGPGFRESEITNEFVVSLLVHVTNVHWF